MTVRLNFYDYRQDRVRYLVELRRINNSMKILSNTSLKMWHTFALPVNAERIIEAYQVQDLIDIWHEHAVSPKLILGEGSNVLFCCDFSGTVILNRLRGIQVSDIEEAWHLHVASGENWHQLVRWTLDKGMAGLENLALIPGMVGSAPIQNIGAYGVEFKQFCEYVDVLFPATGEIKRLKSEECDFDYRHSIFKTSLKDNAIIVAVGLKLFKKWQPNLAYGVLTGLKEKSDLTPLDVFDLVCQVRQEKLPNPHELGNAGSFFKNPIVPKDLAAQMELQYPTMPQYLMPSGDVKLAAGWLIDQAGLKGIRVGDAAVHQAQALVLVNGGHASSQNVIELAKLVVDTVHQKFGVALEHEVRFFDGFGETTLEKVLATEL